MPCTNLTDKAIHQQYCISYYFTWFGLHIIGLIKNPKAFQIVQIIIASDLGNP